MERKKGSMENLVRKPNLGFWHGKKVFLTGHTGFKGSWFLEILKYLGANVVGYSNSVPTSVSHYEILKLDKRFPWSKDNDINSYKNLNRFLESQEFDITVHFAAQSLVIESYKNPLDTYTTNVIGTGNVLTASLQNGIKRNLIITTDKVYENDESGKHYKENDRLGSNDPYSGSKASAEFICKSINDAFGSQDSHVVTARAGNVVGGGDFSLNRLIPDYYRALESGQILEIRSPDAIRPWQHVLEPLLGYIFTIEDMDNLSFDSFNFGPNEESFMSVQDVVKILNDFGNNLATNLYKSDFHESGLLKLDSSLAKKSLNWIPNLSIHETLSLVDKWYKAFINAPSCIQDITRNQIISFLDL